VLDDLQGLLAGCYQLRYSLVRVLACFQQSDLAGHDGDLGVVGGEGEEREGVVVEEGWDLVALPAGVEGGDERGVLVGVGQATHFITGLILLA